MNRQYPNIIDEEDVKNALFDLLTILTDLQMNKPSYREMLLTGLGDQETIFRAANPNFPSVDMLPDIRKIVSFATSHEKLGSLMKEVELLATTPETKRILKYLFGEYRKLKEPRKTPPVNISLTNNTRSEQANEPKDSTAMDNQHPKVFISHSSKDKERFVTAFARKLEERGLFPWVDQFAMNPGDNLYQKIFAEGINNAQAMIVILSENSIKSDWVCQELEAGIFKKYQENFNVIPVIIDGCEVPNQLKPILYHKIDDINNYDDKLAKIVSAIHHSSPKLSPEEVKRRLSDILLNRADLGMSSPSARSVLLQNLPYHQAENIKSKLGSDQKSDIHNIVHWADVYGNLHLIIEKALELAENPGTKIELCMLLR